MTALAKYLEKNKELAYNIASKNTPCNASGRPVITKDDEWRNEPEWDALFLELSNKSNKGENITMKRITTSVKIITALNNGLLEVNKAEIYYKTLGTTEKVNASIFCESLDFLCKSGIFTDALGWHYEKDCKTNGYIAECGRMNPDTELIISVYLSVYEGVNVKDVEKTLLVEDE